MDKMIITILHKNGMYDAIVDAFDKGTKVCVQITPYADNVPFAQIAERAAQLMMDELNSFDPTEQHRMTAKMGDKNTNNFDPAKQYGLFAEIVLDDNVAQGGARYHIVGFDKWCPEAVALAKKWLQKHLNIWIPIEYRSQVKWIIKEPVDGPDPYTRNGTVSWKYTPEKKPEKVLDNPA